MQLPWAGWFDDELIAFVLFVIAFLKESKFEISEKNPTGILSPLKMTAQVLNIFL